MTTVTQRFVALCRARGIERIPVGRIVAEIGPDGSLTRVSHGTEVVVLASSALEAPADTLWSVRLDEKRSSILLRSPILPTTARSSLAWMLRQGGPTLEGKLPEVLRSISAPKAEDDRREDAQAVWKPRRHSNGETSRPKREEPSSKTTYPDRVAVDAVRLTTGLDLETDDPREARQALVGPGIAIEVATAPDFVKLGNRLWARSTDWPVREGRLMAPPEPDRRMVELVRSLEGGEPFSGHVLGLMVLPPCMLRAEVVGYEDWRDDEEVLADSSRIAEALGQDPAAAVAAELERLVAKLGPAKPGDEAERDRFRLRRIVDVARRRALVPIGLASYLQGLEGLDELVAVERAFRLREAMDQVVEETERERTRLTSTLADLQKELAAIERASILAREREIEARRAYEEIRSDVSTLIDRRISEVAFLGEERLSRIERKTEAQLERLATMAATLAESRTDLDAIRHEVGDMVAAARPTAVEAAAGPTTTPEEENSPFSASKAASRPATDQVGTEEADSIREPAPAARALRWHAKRKGVSADALGLGAVVVAAGFVPVFVGARGNAAAVALAEAMGGVFFGILDCDPALLATSDLLDPRRARTDVLLRAVGQARERPDRWHAVALRSVDWAPCAYWLPALGLRGPGTNRLPPNLAVVAAVASDGPRTAIPATALASAVPIVADPYEGNADGDRTTAAWGVEVMQDADVASIESFVVELAQGVDTPEPDVGAAIVAAARAGRRLFGWDGSLAATKLAILAELGATARHGAPPSDRVRSLLENLSGGEGP